MSLVRVFALVWPWICCIGLGQATEFFSKEKIRIQKTNLLVEVARTSDQHAQGLMHRKKLPEGEGMLFIFSEPRVLSFWMKNTLIPLDIGFFDENGVLLEVQQMVPPQNKKGEPPSYKSKKASLYALEVPKDFFKSNGIAIGSRFEWINSSKKSSK